jgi:exonuclease III
MAMNLNRNCNILCWNLRGINSNQKWLALNDKIAKTACSIICLQETKREHFDHSYLRKFCPKRFDKFAFHPSVGASGGIIVIWNSSVVSGVVIASLPYAITIEFSSTMTLTEKWLLSNINGSCAGELRDEFVNWMNSLIIDPDQCWILMGDFNFVRSVQNRNLPRGDMNDIFIFNEIISNVGLVEIPLKGRSFTWSNM